MFFHSTRIKQKMSTSTPFRPEMMGAHIRALILQQQQQEATEPAYAVDETKPAVLEARAALAQAIKNRADITVGAYCFLSNGRHINSVATAEVNLRHVLRDPCNHLPPVAPVAAELAAEPADAPSATSEPNPEA